MIDRLNICLGVTIMKKVSDKELKAMLDKYAQEKGFDPLDVNTWYNADADTVKVFVCIYILFIYLFLF